MYIVVISYGSCGQQQNLPWQKWRQIAGDFDCHADAAEQCGMHRPIKHIQGFTQSHWMLPLGECLMRIALATPTVIKIGGKHKNTTNTQLLASNYGTNQSLVVYEKFIPQNGPSTQLIDVTHCIKVWGTMIEEEELTHIYSYQTLSEVKNLWIY